MLKLVNYHLESENPRWPQYITENVMVTDNQSQTRHQLAALACQTANSYLYQFMDYHLETVRHTDAYTDTHKKQLLYTLYFLRGSHKYGASLYFSFLGS